LGAEPLGDRGRDPFSLSSRPRQRESAALPTDGSDTFPSTPAFPVNRRWEISLAASRQYWAYTPKAISQTTRADEQSANITWTPDSRFRLAASLYHRGIAPEFLAPTVSILNADSTQVVGVFAGRVFRVHGNGGTLTATRTVWKEEKSQLEAGYDAMAFGYTHPTGLPIPEYYLNTGVFTPSFYQRHAGLLRATLGWKYVQWELHGTAGVQQVRQKSNLSFSSTAGTRLDFLLSRKTTLSLGYDYFNTASGLQAFLTPLQAAGYHSNNLTASLDFRF
jgi:ribosomal protein L35AE/L33A